MVCEGEVIANIRPQWVNCTVTDCYLCVVLGGYKSLTPSLQSLHGEKISFVHITASALCPGYNLLTLYKRWLLSEFKGMTGRIVGWQSRTLGVQEVLVNEELNLSASLFFFLFFGFILLIAFIFLSHHRQLVLSVVTAQHSLMLYWYFECLSGCIFFM